MYKFLDYLQVVRDSRASTQRTLPRLVAKQPLQRGAAVIVRGRRAYLRDEMLARSGDNPEDDVHYTRVRCYIGKLADSS